MALLIGAVLSVAIEEVGWRAAPDIVTTSTSGSRQISITGWMLPFILTGDSVDRAWYRATDVRAVAEDLNLHDSYDAERALVLKWMREDAAKKADQVIRHQAARAAWGADGPRDLWLLVDTKPTFPADRLSPARDLSIATGFPFRMVTRETGERMTLIPGGNWRSWNRVMVYGRAVSPTQALHGMLILGGGLYRVWVLPLGLAANTLVYSFVGLSLNPVWRRLLAIHRRRRGLCGECAYPAAGLSRCPECGQLCGGVAPAGGRRVEPVP